MKYLSETRECMGTPFEVTVGFCEDQDDEEVSELIAAAFAEALRIEKTYSRFLEGNELARLNARLGEWVDVSQELYDLIKFGCFLGRETSGAFDLTVKSVLEGWGYDSVYSLKDGRGGSCGSVELSDGCVNISAEIDLGGLGKGYALDCMRKFLQGFSSVCVNAGGDLWADGLNPKGEPWKALFEHPTDPKQAIGFVEVNGLALACSNPNRRVWRDHHHLVDPLSGKPASEMLAVYTQANLAFHADAYATALFAMGYEAAKVHLEHFPVEAMLVSPRSEIYRSTAFRGELFTAQQVV